MIVHLDKFVHAEEPYWKKLEDFLERIEADALRALSLQEARDLHYLYQRASSDLSRFSSLSSQPEMRHYLEALVARAYAEIHETRAEALRWNPVRWFFREFPAAFRRRAGAFWLATALLAAGAAFGGFLAITDSAAKETLISFDGLHGRPSERVAEEERRGRSHVEPVAATFSAMLMTNNTKVAITTMALGITWGIGTIILLFYNGVILGLVAIDYIADGQALFLFGWLLPHGVIEIPAILIGAQAGLVLGSAMIGHGNRYALRERFRQVLPDLAHLVGGAAALLIWAGIIESFFSQTHEPVIPYAVKIAFGIAEFFGLAYLLMLGGRMRNR